MSSVTKTLAELITDSIKAQLLDLHTSLPAKVESYDPAKQFVKVQPMLQRKFVNEDPVNLPIIENVPVLFFGANAGKSFLTFPIKAGDLGFIFFSERSLDKYLSSNGNSPVFPDNGGIHDLSDGFFFPGGQTDITALKDINANDVFLRNDQIKLTLYPTGKLEIKGASQEMISVISAFMEQAVSAVEEIAGSTVATGIGTQPLINAAAITIIKNLMDAEKTKFDTFKK